MSLCVFGEILKAIFDGADQIADELPGVFEDFTDGTARAFKPINDRLSGWPQARADRLERDGRQLPDAARDQRFELIDRLHHGRFHAVDAFTGTEDAGLTNGFFDVVPSCADVDFLQFGFEPRPRFGDRVGLAQSFHHVFEWARHERSEFIQNRVRIGLHGAPRHQILAEDRAEFLVTGQMTEGARDRVAHAEALHDERIALHVEATVGAALHVDARGGKGGARCCGVVGFEASGRSLARGRGGFARGNL